MTYFVVTSISEITVKQLNVIKNNLFLFEMRYINTTENYVKSQICRSSQPYSLPYLELYNGIHSFSLLVLKAHSTQR